MKQHSAPQTWTAVAIGASGILLSIAGLIPPIQSGETNIWFWILCLAGIGALIMAIAVSRSRKFFKRLARIFLGPEGDVVLEIRSAHDREVAQVYDLARQEFGEEVTSADKAREIRSKYRDAITVAVCRDQWGAAVIRGYYMAFPVNKSLVDKIERLRMNVNEIAASEVAAKPQYGYAFYIGGIVGHGWRVRAELLGALKRDNKKPAMTKTGTAYARAATDTGRARLLKHGFEPVHAGLDGVGGFFRKTFAK